MGADGFTIDLPAGRKPITLASCSSDLLLTFQCGFSTHASRTYTLPCLLKGVFFPDLMLIISPPSDLNNTWLPLSQISAAEARILLTLGDLAQHPLPLADIGDKVYAFLPFVENRLSALGGRCESLSTAGPL